MGSEEAPQWLWTLGSNVGLSYYGGKTYIKGYEEWTKGSHAIPRKTSHSPPLSWQGTEVKQSAELYDRFVMQFKFMESVMLRLWPVLVLFFIETNHQPCHNHSSWRCCLQRSCPCHWGHTFPSSSWNYYGRAGELYVVLSVPSCRHNCWTWGWTEKYRYGMLYNLKYIRFRIRWYCNWLSVWRRYSREDFMISPLLLLTHISINFTLTIYFGRRDKWWWWCRCNVEGFDSRKCTLDWLSE